MALLKKAQVNGRDPLLFIDREGVGNYLPTRMTEMGGLLCHAPSWLPATPVAELIPLSECRRSVYMSRFAERQHLSGWLLFPKKPPTPTVAWFFRQMLTTHVPGRIVEDSDWQLQWFESKTRLRHISLGLLSCQERCRYECD